MTRPAIQRRRVPVAGDGALATLLSIEPFILAPGHPMRGSSCLLCPDCIGGAPATLIGVAGLGGPPCGCGAVTSDVFLSHAAHFPVDPVTLRDALQRALEGTCSCD